MSTKKPGLTAGLYFSSSEIRCFYRVSMDVEPAIAFGLSICLYAIKGQITRFALKSRRGPHMPTGADAPKKLMREIERRLNIVRKIQGEPPLLTARNLNLFLATPLKEISPPHLYRMKVFEDVKSLDALMNVSRRRHSGDEVQSYYLKLYKDKLLSDLSLADLNKFFFFYERARHEPQEFSAEEYKIFVDLLESVRNNLAGNATALPCDHVERNVTLSDSAGAQSVERPENTSFSLKKCVSFDLKSNKQKNSTPLETPV